MGVYTKNATGKVVCWSRRLGAEPRPVGVYTPFGVYARRSGVYKNLKSKQAPAPKSPSLRHTPNRQNRLPYTPEIETQTNVSTRGSVYTSSQLETDDCWSSRLGSPPRPAPPPISGDMRQRREKIVWCEDKQRCIFRAESVPNSSQ